MSDSQSFRFPEKIVVSSPETDKKIDAITASVVTLIKTYEQHAQTLAAQLASIERVTADGLSGVEQQFQKQMQMSVVAQFDSQIESQRAEVTGLESRRDALVRLLEERINSIKQGIEKLETRYKALLETVAENNVLRRKKLDGHAYEILDVVFEEQIQKKLERVSLPTYEYLQLHAPETAVARTAGIDEALTAAKRSLNQYLRDFSEPRDTLTSFQTDAIGTGEYLSHVYYVKTRNRGTGEESWELWSSEGPIELSDFEQSSIKEHLASKGSQQRESLQQLASAITAELKRGGTAGHSLSERLRNDLGLSASSGGERHVG